MMKRNILKEIAVWLLIVAGLAVFAGFAYIIAGNKNSFGAFAVYKTVLAESDGIYAGTKVSIHGKNTGNVVATRLLPDGQVEARFSVRKAHIFGITESSVVYIKQAGALGDRFLNIVTKDMSAKQLKKGALIPYENAPSLLSFLNESGDDVKKSLKSALAEINSLLESLKQKTGKGEGLLLSRRQSDDLSQILKSARSVLEKIDSGQGTLGALINDPELYNRLNVLLGRRPNNNYLRELSRKSQK